MPIEQIDALSRRNEHEYEDDIKKIQLQFHWGA